MNEQAIPHVLRWAAQAGYISSRDRDLLLAYDTTPPQARKAEADAITAVAQAVKAMKEAGFDPDFVEMQARFRLPVKMASAPEIGALPDATQEASTKDRRRTLAEDMTAHGAPTCRHGNPNICRICGVHRIDDVVPSVDGSAPGYKLHWYAIDDDPRTTAPGGEA
jgi:hypothetical protein